MTFLRYGFPREQAFASFTVAVTGLSTDSLGDYGAVGGHASIGYVETPTSATETVKWSNSSNPADPATYGTGAAPTDYTASENGTVYLHVTDGAETVTEAFGVRYAEGTAAAVADGQSWTVDDTSVNINGAATGANLTFGYVLTGSADGVTINAGSGLITGTPTAASSGTATITATDQYGRTLQDTFTWVSALRAQATGGVDLDLTFPEDSAIGATNLIQNWTANGNTLTLVSVAPTLPTGLTVNSAGVMSGTPTTVTADNTYTITMQDEYGRQTADTFTLEITAASAAPTISTFTIGAYSPTPSPNLAASISATDVQDGVDQCYFAILPNAEPDPTDAAAIKAGTTPNAVDFITTTFNTAGNTAAIVAGLDGLYKVAIVIEGPGGFSNIAVDASITIDSTLPILSSPTGTQTGATTADGSVTSDEADGTIYAGVWPTASTPSVADIIAGTGATYHTTDATPTAGVNNFAATGLTASTAYKWQYAQVDDFGNQSTAATSAEFTTAAGSSFAFDVTDAITTGFPTDVSSFTQTVSIGAADAGREVVAVLVAQDTSGLTVSAFKETNAGGADFTLRSAYANNGLAGLAVYSLGVATGTTMDIYVAFSGAMSRSSLIIGRLVDGTIQAIDHNGADGAAALTASLNVIADDRLLCVNNVNLPLANFGVTGMTNTPTFFEMDQGDIEYVVDTIAAPETPRTASEDATANTGKRLALVNFRTS